MKSIMIVEPQAVGHYMQYVRRLIGEAIRRELQVTLLTSKDSLQHSGYTDLLSEYPGAFQTALLPQSTTADKLLASRSLLLKQVGRHLMYRSFFKSLQPSERPDFVFVPFFEAVDYATTILGSPFGDTRWAGLIIKYSFHYKDVGVVRPARRTDVLKRLAFLTLLRLRRIECLFTIDPTLLSYGPVQSAATPIHYVVDPHDIHGVGSRDDARAALNIPADAIVILVYGDFTISAERKGLDTLLMATQAGNFPRKVVLLVAGAQGSRTKELLAGPAATRLRAEGRLIEQNWYHSTQEEYEAFIASDIVWVGYRNYYGPSGIMIQAGAVELPVIASNYGIIGWFVRRHGLGPVVDANDPGAISATVAELAQSPELRKAYGLTGKQLAANYTSAAFCERIYDVIMGQSAAVKPADPAYAS